MEIKNNKEEVPFQHYLQEFQRMDPEDAVRRLEIPFDGKAFALDFLNETYTITWPEYTISSGDPNAFALGRLSPQIFLLHYLLSGKYLPAGDTWKTFRQLPWGEVYNRTFNGRCIRRCAFTFGRALNQFAAASRKLGGALSFPSCRTTASGSVSGRRPRSFHPAPRSSFPTISRPVSRRRITWWRRSF